MACTTCQTRRVKVSIPFCSFLSIQVYVYRYSLPISSVSETLGNGAVSNADAAIWNV